MLVSTRPTLESRQWHTAALQLVDLRDCRSGTRPQRLTDANSMLSDKIGKLSAKVDKLAKELEEAIKKLEGREGTSPEGLAAP